MNDDIHALAALGIPVYKSAMAMADGFVQKRRHRRIRGKRVPIRWMKRHGTKPGKVPGYMLYRDPFAIGDKVSIVVHPAVYDQFKAAVEAMPIKKP